MYVTTSTVSNYLKIIATVVTLLVVCATLLAGVVDVKSRVGVLERDAKSLEGKFDRYCRQQYEQYEQIQSGLQDLKVGQAVLRQKIEQRW